jgi:KUP system potassium uptake protein
MLIRYSNCVSKTKKGIAALTIGALGVVFGDIGTSPLYALQAIFSPIGQHLPVTTVSVNGIISLIIWSVILVVSVKYIGFIMRVNNKGEGGIMALVTLIKSSGLSSRYKWAFIFLGLVGVALFYGDSAITPAISVLSAVEGLRVVAPDLREFIVPISLVILSLLFWIQKYGTAVIGRLFGPVMLLWFVVIAIGGALQIVQHPDILAALSPLSAIAFFAAQPLIAFIALGVVILAVTGAEALYADMGHFDRRPIARAWFFLVFPALTLCYLGQGALILHNPASVSSTFVLLFPQEVRIFVVILAMLATLIASQSVISGAFSLTRQAVHLNFLPKMFIRHTSASAGQVYLPFVNIALFISVMLLVVFFGASEKLASAYGLAVSGTLAVDTILFIVVMRVLWRRSLLYVVLATAIFLSIDIAFVAANLSKLLHGGWFPISLAVLILVLIRTWLKGQQIVNKKRRQLEGSLQTYIDKIHADKQALIRVPGHAIYINHHTDRAPLALHTTVEQLHELHEKVVIVSVDITNSAHIPEDERYTFDNLKYNDGISHLSLVYGFHDSPNVPKTLQSLRHISPELDFNPSDASYFVSLSKIVPTRKHTMTRWRKYLYAMMDRNALSPSDYYRLPIERTVEIRSLIEL